MYLRRFKWYRKLDNFCQRGKKGYCVEDLWDLKHWFTKLFPKMLDEFLINSNGYPCSPCVKGVENEEAWYKEQERKWHYEVKKLIWYLREANEETCSEKNEIEYKVDFKFIKEKEDSPFSKLEFVYPTKEDEEKSDLYSKRHYEIEKYQEENFHKALEQFEKISSHLWD